MNKLDIISITGPIRTRDEAVRFIATAATVLPSWDPNVPAIKLADPDGSPVFTDDEAADVDDTLCSAFDVLGIKEAYATWAECVK
jgi:hypothetical protein